MATATLAREARALLAEARGLTATETPLLARLRREPEAVLTAASVVPDQWQLAGLCSPCPRTLLCCSRQSGKSLVAGAIALLEALCRAGALVLVLSASERQAKEFFQVNIAGLWRRLGRPVPGEETATALCLGNGSRVIALPENERTVRVYSGVTLLVIDEAARVSDGLYYTVRPMLAVSGGRLLALTTPFGKRGWFYETWVGRRKWHRVKITAAECPRLSLEFLAEERASLGERWYRQEYCCSFEDTVDAVFQEEDIQALCAGDVPPLFPVTAAALDAGPEPEPELLDVPEYLAIPGEGGHDDADW